MARGGSNDLPVVGLCLTWWAPSAWVAKHSSVTVLPNNRTFSVESIKTQFFEIFTLLWINCIFHLQSAKIWCIDKWGLGTKFSGRLIDALLQSYHSISHQRSECCSKDRLQKYILQEKVSCGTEEERDQYFLGTQYLFSADQHLSFNLPSDIWNQERNGHQSPIIFSTWKL